MATLATPIWRSKSPPARLHWYTPRARRYQPQLQRVEPAGQRDGQGQQRMRAGQLFQRARISRHRSCQRRLPASVHHSSAANSSTVNSALATTETTAALTGVRVSWRA